MKRSKVNLSEVLGDMGTTKATRVADNLTNSMLNTKQIIKVSLNKVYVAKQIRLKINQDTVDGIVKSVPISGLKNLAEIRKVTPAIDEDSVPEGYDYVLLTGEHRFRALEILGMAEHDFSFIPPSIIKTKEDVIRYQYEENNVRSEMHIVEKANTLQRFLELGVTQANAAEKMGITTSLASRLNRINKHIDEEDKLKIIELDIKSERVIVSIAKLIELGHTDWLSVIRPYALDDKGEFDPELIYEKTLTQIIKDLTAPPEPEKEPAPEKELEPQNQPVPPKESEPQNQPEPQENSSPVVETPKPLADDIIPNAFKEEAEQSAQASAQPNAATPTAPATSTEVVLNSVEAAVEDMQEDESESSSQQSSAPYEVETAPTRMDSPTPSPTSTDPVAKGDEKQSAFKLAANVLQQILMGKEVQEILISLGPDLKNYVSKEDGEDIYNMIQNLPFEQHNP
ncbi:hypothetical protein [Acinetobacter ursingii]|uniref:hypothetical protein n=1 Tax=Acinetobacter ursingii TaxID=108980 RepID=UPI00254C58A3|nr:hypothetical protein [Acinetobacter ursingii]MEC6128243.1 hypothetical protein [Acinetobacter ursingii]